MELPLGYTVVRSVIAKELDGTPTAVPTPGKVELTDQAQKMLLRFRGVEQGRPTEKWYVAEAAVPTNADTLLVGTRRFIMHLCGQILQEPDGSIGFNIMPSENSTGINQAHEVNLNDKEPIREMIDCLILSDGRTFFINGSHEEYKSLALSLGIPVKF